MNIEEKLAETKKDVKLAKFTFLVSLIGTLVTVSNTFWFLTLFTTTLFCIVLAMLYECKYVAFEMAKERVHWHTLAQEHT